MADGSELPDTLEQAIEESSTGIHSYDWGAMLHNVVHYAAEYARNRGEEEKVEHIHDWAENVDVVLAAALESGDTVYRCEACSYNWFGAESGGTCPRCNRRAPVENLFARE